MTEAKPQYVTEWLQTYAKQNTRRVFKAGLLHFMESIYGTGALNRAVEEYAAKYVEECRGGRDWFKDLLKYAADLHGRPPKSARAFITAAKGWLEYTLNVEVSKRQQRLLLGRLPKGSKARTQEMELTREVLRKILAHADVKGRALFLFLQSSGVRVGEALKLKLGDVDLNKDPAEVNVKGEYTKSGDAYISFLTSEAREALVEWLKVREAYIESARNRGRGLGRIKRLRDERIFPFSLTVAEQMWQNAIVKAGLADRDVNTNRHKLHIHMLRKFFLSQAKVAVPESVAEVWAGHSGYLDEAYRRYSREQLRDFYKRAEPYLLVGVPKDVVEIQSKFQKDVDQLREQIFDLTRKLTDANAVNLQLLSENAELKLRIAKAEEKLAELETLIRKLLAPI
ncbi:tyrosine-type recombinase/integrase [Candidatus Bathyarchaeota archaeon]|nr:tyrosine-type recombinase/integrase [Candidatus Bathyarchaeota archaeon]